MPGGNRFGDVISLGPLCVSMIRLSAKVAVDERELEERFVRASGPGGQNVNKVATAVELRFHVASSSLAPEIKVRLLAQAGRRITSNGVLVIESREHRTQLQNRQAARRRLAEFLERAAQLPKRRRPTTARPGVDERRLTTKRRRGRMKALRAATGREDE